MVWCHENIRELWCHECEIIQVISMACIVVHRVSYKVNHNTVNLSTDVDVSHLCHNSMCIKAEHLSLEPHHINNNRQFCKSKQQCFRQGVYASCRLSLALPIRYLFIFFSIFSLLSCLLLHLDLVWSRFVRSCLCCLIRSDEVRSGQVRSGQVRSILYIGDSTHFSVLQLRLINVLLISLPHFHGRDRDRHTQNILNISNY